MAKKKVIVSQTVDINVSYLYEYEDNGEEFDAFAVTRQFREENGYEKFPVVDIELLDWDLPWDANETDEFPKPLTEEAIRAVVEQIIAFFPKAVKS
jgi:hypothetical protein